MCPGLGTALGTTSQLNCEKGKEGTMKLRDRGSSNPTKEKSALKINLCRAGGLLAAVFLTTALAVAGENGRDIFVLTSTNNSSDNEVVVFKLNTAGTPSL